MARQERIQPGAARQDAGPEPDPGPPVPAAGARTAGLDAHIDSVLDEIDSVLERNAAGFVANFVQKGGQ